ncbi:hypothetical protein EXE46_15915 [Halorubrum sp. GN11_10-6_MGM]|uniref:hypothetical protein n=1 Tax=Halorubrum sp. GN11_10-6_MGM TaxID=2518112 RepID=UPI0010F6BE02|nr:hypothetical protein [Halorubrum sp. GN11_10-6_MGM]TKX72360.1 hypothetical protein EXE46_15915 [Halorubrum sp. GN11_10-6_MGM]
MDSSDPSQAGTRASRARARRSRRWSIFAGVYAFGCAVLTASLLSTVLGVFAEVIGLPAALAVPLLATPALAAGTAAWWALVERRGSVTYVRGAAFGLLTALITGGFWTARFASVWSVEMLTAGPVPLLVGVVFGAVAVAGILVGLPFTYARRRRRPPADASPTANSL